MLGNTYITSGFWFGDGFFSHGYALCTVYHTQPFNDVPAHTNKPQIYLFIVNCAAKFLNNLLIQWFY